MLALAAMIELLISRSFPYLAGVFIDLIAI